MVVVVMGWWRDAVVGCHWNNGSAQSPPSLPFCQRQINNYRRWGKTEAIASKPSHQGAASIIRKKREKNNKSKARKRCLCRCSSSSDIIRFAWIICIRCAKGEKESSEWVRTSIHMCDRLQSKREEEDERGKEETAIVLSRTITKLVGRCRSTRHRGPNY